MPSKTASGAIRNVGKALAGLPAQLSISIFECLFGDLFTAPGRHRLRAVIFGRTRADRGPLIEIDQTHARAETRDVRVVTG
jgi:hypothetical protein